MITYLTRTASAVALLLLAGCFSGSDGGLKSFEEENKLLNGKFNCRLLVYKTIHECSGLSIVHWWIKRSSDDPNMVQKVELQWKRDSATQSILDYMETRGLPEDEFKKLRMAMATGSEMKIFTEDSLIWYTQDRSSTFHSRIKITPFH
ncbi:MAG: hypothetical protein OIF58_13555 [Cohaesibacter sp.]|nr:hypothetical protein [Cohaesibacter sp.]